MVHVDQNDPAGAEAGRRELARRVAGQRPAFPPPELSPRDGTKATGDWRIGDDYPLTFDGAILERPKVNPYPDREWRLPDKSGIECLGRKSDRTWASEAIDHHISPLRGPESHPSSPRAWGHAQHEGTGAPRSNQSPQWQSADHSSIQQYSPRRPRHVTV